MRIWFTLALALAVVSKPIDLNRFGGHWFEIARTKNLRLEMGDSVVFTLTPAADRTIQIEYESKEEPKVFQNYGIATPTADPSHYLIRITNNFLTRLFTFDVEVVETDYDSYALVYSKNRFFWFIDHTCLWILSRNKKLDPNVLSHLLKTIEKNYQITEAQIRYTSHPDTPQTQTN